MAQDLVNHYSPPQAKIALFRSLFRGREDVYPRRFQSHKTGASGYQPACANEWVRGVCQKPKVRCLDCPKDQLLQEHGYFVLRFLADDVGKCLDDVLDAILRVLTHQHGRRF